MTKADMTQKQQEIYTYIKRIISIKGYPPSVREICEAVGLRSTSTVHGHLERLEKKGLIKRDPTKPRAIEIINNDGDYRGEIIPVPIVGKVAAGTPILAVENIESQFPIPSEFFATNKEMFMLQVKGSSMINAGIFEGDYVIVQKQNTANNGDIVVALINENATIKTFYKEEDHIRLQPQNPDMEPIIVNKCSILGKAIGLFRKM